MEETNYLTYDEIPTEVKDAIANNKTVGVAFVKKDGSVRHMAFRRYLMGYVPSEKEKTEKQLTMRVTHNQMTVYDTNLYIKAYRELQDVDKAAKQSFRIVTLDRVLGFLVGGNFLDMREKNNISERYGEDVYNEITKGMVRAMEKEAQEAETSANELESEVNEQYLNEDKWNRTRFQRLIEVMQKVDPSFKPKLNENNVKPDNREQEIINDILSTNESVGDWWNKFVQYGKRGMLSLAIITMIASSAQAKEDNKTTDVIKTGIEYVNNVENQDKEFFNLVIGIAEAYRKKALNDKNIDIAGAFQEVRNHYTDKRDGKAPLSLYRGAQLAQKTIFNHIEQLMKDNKESDIKYYINHGRNPQNWHL